MRSILLLCAVAMTVSGCATKRYGRLQPLSAVEAASYDCREIAIELSKIDAFELEIKRGSKIDGASAMGFLGDFGIGNANEKNAAEQSALERRAQLQRLQIERKCAPGVTNP